MCADYFETERYITPSERYALLRTMPYFIFLMDGDDEKHTLARIKHLHLDRFQRIFKVPSIFQPLSFKGLLLQMINFLL
jgi:hypothetical protein